MSKPYWTDKKHIMGLPISFTRYTLDPDKLTIRSGLLTLREDEIRLYRIRDVSLVCTLINRILGVGTIIVDSADTNLPHMHITRVKNPAKVRDLLSKCVEEARATQRIRVGEFMGNPGESEFDSLDRDGSSLV